MSGEAAIFEREIGVQTEQALRDAVSEAPSEPAQR